MATMSDIVALKRVDMETVQRQRRAMTPITPRLVTWNVNNERPNIYFPNINRSYVADLTYVPGHFITRKMHRNCANREASWSPYTNENLMNLSEKPEVTEELEEELKNRSSLTDSIYKPEFRINKVLGMLKREYKHPLSMYECELGKFSRYANSKQRQDPTMPRQYYSQPPYGVYWYAERPPTAGKDWDGGCGLVEARRVLNEHRKVKESQEDVTM